MTDDRPRSLDAQLTRERRDSRELATVTRERDELLDAARRVLDGHLHRAVIRQSDLDNLTRLDELVAKLVPAVTAARVELRDGRYCPDHDVDLVPPGRTLATRRYCPKCPPGSPLGFPAEEQP